MSDELTLLSELIEKKTGLFFPPEWALETLQARLTPRLEEKGIGSFSAYRHFLSGSDGSADEEWRSVIAALSKSVSTFFRHQRRTRALAETVLPRWVSKTNSKTLRIWSAGCASGEEPLAIAMALSEGGWFDRLQIEINACDGNFVAIETAQRGIYGDEKVFYLPAGLRDKYFDRAGEGWRVKAALHEKINWSVANLLDENNMAALASSDIIFCRNVFIYFSNEAIVRTLRFFAAQMRAGGYLFTDAGDHFRSLMSQAGVFRDQQIPGVSVWKKK